MFRTDLNDNTCAQNSAKIDPDDDGEAGGCDNVRISIETGGAITVEYWRQPD